MNVIPGATLLNQLNAPTSDGLPDENHNDNCVPSSIAEGLHILTGGSFNPDELKDAVYGQGWTGFQAAASYVSYCAAHGVTLAPHNDSQAGLVAFIHSQVSAGHPVVLTMPSQWGTAPANPVNPSGSTHVGVAVGEQPGSIRVMNPWGGFWQDQSDAWWQARLCYGQVWTMSKKAGTVSGVPSGWSDNGSILKAPNGKQCQHGIRAFVLSNNWDAGDVPVSDELDVNPVEIGHAALGAGAIQFFLKTGQISWTPSAGVFRTYNGQEEVALHAALDAAKASAAQAQTLAASLQSQLVAARAKLAALEAAPPPAPPAPSQDDLNAAALVAALKKALA